MSIPIPWRPLGAILLAAAGASACDSCGCRMPSDLTPQSGLFVGLFEQYTDFGTLRQDGRKIGNDDDQYMHSATTQAIIGYHFTPWLSVAGFLPYIVRDYSRADFTVTQKGRIQGLGDTTVLASLRVVHADHGDDAYSVNLLGGMKIPTGKPTQLQYELMDTPSDDADPDSATGGHDLALGSGAYDFIGGVALNGRLGDWYLTAQGTYTYNTEGAYFYRYANEIAAQGGIGYYLVVNPDWHVAAQGNIDGDSKGHDRVAGQTTPDTMNNNLYAGPELIATYHRHLTGDAAVDIPLEEHNSDVQLVPTWRIRGSLVYSF